MVNPLAGRLQPSARISNTIPLLSILYFVWARIPIDWWLWVLLAGSIVTLAYNEALKPFASQLTRSEAWERLTSPTIREGWNNVRRMLLGFPMAGLYTVAVLAHFILYVVLLVITWDLDKFLFAIQAVFLVYSFVFVGLYSRFKVFFKAREEELESPSS